MGRTFTYSRLSKYSCCTLQWYCTLDFLTWDSIGAEARTGDNTEGSITALAVNDFSPFTFGGLVNNALPLELIAFKGMTVGGENVLTWITAKEENCSHFDIKWSNEAAKNFTAIAQIPAASLNQDFAFEYHYDYRHNVNHPVNYYRLKRVDLNGDFTYSPIIKLVNQQVTGNRIYAYPNPVVDGILNLEATTPLNSDVNIYNALGTLVYVAPMQQTSKLQINVANLQAGMYFIHVMVDGQLEVIKFTK